MAQLVTTSNVQAAAPPPWVHGAGVDPSLPDERFLVGYGLASTESGARSLAEGELSRRIRVRIQQEFRDSTRESNGQRDYEVAAVTVATSDAQLENVRYRRYRDDAGEFHVLAILSRADAAERWDARVAQRLRETRTCGRAERVRTLVRCRTLLLDALELDISVRIIAGRTDPKRRAILLRAYERVSTLIDDALQTPARSIAQLAEQLAERMALPKVAELRVAPATYETTQFASVFGRRLATELEAALAQRTKGGPTTIQAAVRGSYFVAPKHVRVLFVARNVSDGRLLSSGEGKVLRAKIDVPLKPQNFAQALLHDALLGVGELVSGSLRLELWTNRGDRGLVFEEHEEVKLYMRVNKPAWVQLVYLLVNGARVPLAQAYYIDSSKVNRVVEYVDSFEVVPPFGVERLFGVAFDRRPPPLPTRRRQIDGEMYEVVVSDETLVKHRGLKKKAKAPQMSEAVLTLTTIPRQVDRQGGTHQ